MSRQKSSIFRVENFFPPRAESVCFPTQGTLVVVFNGQRLMRIVLPDAFMGNK